MKRFLITTADERTWPKDQPVLFLGEWCKLYDRRHIWAGMDAKMVPYHWDDRKKLHQDYLYLQDLYEELLLDLSERLNSFHGVNHTQRYWRILVGKWLGYFVQMLFDRWEMIQKAISDYSIAGVWILDTTQEQAIPNDMVYFSRLFKKDAWNEAIYGQLLHGFTTVPVEMVSIDKEQITEAGMNEEEVPIARRLKRNLARAASHVSQMLNRNDESFFLTSSLPIKEDFLLQWRMGQVPKRWSSFPPPVAVVDWATRQWQMGQSVADGFSAIARAMIPRHIPAIYLEGYAALQALCATLPWPKKPRLIFTSSSYYTDDVFKSWAATKVEDGAPLVLGQHGGNYGLSLFNFSEDHQCAISDVWLSWGWEGGTNDKIKPVINLKIAGRRLGWDPEGCVLMVEMAMPRYSYALYSTPVAGQWLDYFSEQCRFVDALPDGIRGRLLVRLYIHDYEWCQAARWKERFPNVHLNDGATPIAPLIEKSRLCISTYNSTTLLESLSMNIPTIIFWNKNLWELRDTAIPYIDRLKEVGIFHNTPESAAAKVVAVWDDVPGWWSRPEVQAARQYFCERFSRTVDNPIQVLKEALTTNVSQNSDTKI